MDEAIFFMQAKLGIKLNEIIVPQFYYTNLLTSQNMFITDIKKII